MKKDIGVFIYFVLGSIYATFPLIFHLTTSLPHTGDELLITWILSWNIHAVFTHPLTIFHAPIFFPYLNTLAYSDVFFTASGIGIIPWILFNQPLAVYNFLLLFAFTTTGFCTYLLTTYLTKSRMAGVVSGSLVAFSTYTITKTMHLQLIGIAFVPLGMLFFLQFAKTKQMRYFILFCLCFFFQTANSFLPSYFLLFSCFILWIFFYLSDKKKFYIFLQKKVFFIAALTVVCLIPIVTPYVQVSKQFHHVRDIRDSIHFANRPEYTFFPSDRTRLQPLLLETFYKHDTGPYKYDGYIGFTFFILFFICLWYYFFKAKKTLPFFTPFFCIALFGFILSLGPALQWGGKVLKIPFIIPLPYAIFYYLVPGFNGMRNSARWEMLFLVASSVCIGIVLAALYKKRLQRWAMGITIGICIVIFLEIPLPMQRSPLPPVPQTNYYLQTLPKDTAIIEMPIYTWYMHPYASQELYREYFNTVDFSKRMNGFSGFSPLQWEKDVSSLLAHFPNTESIKSLKKRGITYIVVHKDEYTVLANDAYIVEGSTIPSGKEVINRLSSTNDVVLIKQIGNDYIYKIK